MNSVPLFYTLLHSFSDMSKFICSSWWRSQNGRHTSVTRTASRAWQCTYVI